MAAFLTRRLNFLPEFWHVGDGGRHFSERIVEQVQNLHVFHVGDGGRKLRHFVVAQSQPGDVLHAPEPRHIVQMDEVFVAKVDLSIRNVLSFV